MGKNHENGKQDVQNERGGKEGREAKVLTATSGTASLTAVGFR